ncbi:MAG: hypothetical protein AB1750_09430 [Chloroflexota bacterium]
MSASLLRWQRALAVVMAVVMVLALFTPTAADATKAPVPQQAGQVQGKVFQSTRNGSTDGSLLALAEKLYGPTRVMDDTSAPANYGPYNVQKGTFQLPWTKNQRRSGGRTLPFGPQPAAPGGTDGRIIDDPSPDPWWSWQGVNQGGNRTLFGFGFLPPDTNGDTSGDAWWYGYYVQTINTTFAVWDYGLVNVYGGWPKTVLGPIPINSLFYGFGGPCEYTNDGDPIVLYDEQADVWMISQFALPSFPYGPFYQCIAVSWSGDPTGGWYLYEFEMPLLWVDDDDESSTPQVLGYKMNDYPKFGIWQDSYIMTVNQFNEGSLGWGGAGIAAFNRWDLLAGGPVSWVYFDPFGDSNCSMETYYTVETNPLCFLGGMLPADNDGAWANWGGYNTGYVMMFDDDAWSTPSYTLADQLELWAVDVDWIATYLLYWLANFPVAAFDSNMCGYSRNCIDQPNTTQGLDAIADRLMARLEFRPIDRDPYGGPTYEAMVTNHTIDVGGDRAGVRWYELRRDYDWINFLWGPWYLYQQGTIAPTDGNSRWMGSAAIDSVGNIAVGYSVSGANLAPQIRYSARQVNDPLGAMRDEKSISNTAIATGSQTSSSARWGDYSAMNVAPVNPMTWGPEACMFTYTNEYYRGVTPAEFYTLIGEFAFDNCLYNDAEAPDIWWVYTPPAVDYFRDGFFSWDAWDASGIAYYMCQLDGGAWFYCSPDWYYYGLSTGLHSFSVYAVDVWGNVSDTLTWWWEITAATATYLSNANLDGYMFESNEFSDVGGTGSSASGYYIFTGDQNYDKQVKGLFSFTTSLPGTAVITNVMMAMRLSGYVGTSPYTTHGSFYVDMGVPFFGATQALAAHDFEAGAFEYDAAGCTTLPDANNWFYCYMYNPWNVPTSGTVQFRTYFAMDDNDDNAADLVRWFSGGYPTLSFRPYLLVDYFIP